MLKSHERTKTSKQKVRRKQIKKALNNELKAAKDTEKTCSVLTAKTVSELDLEIHSLKKGLRRVSFLGHIYYKPVSYL